MGRHGEYREPAGVEGIENRIHVSTETRELLGDSYLFEARGLIEIKGKSPLETYFLTGRAPA